jgi:hypothetical protein
LSLTTRKKQSTRMLKAVCSRCGYTVRLTSKWAYMADGKTPNLPQCPTDPTVTLKLA